MKPHKEPQDNSKDYDDALFQALAVIKNAAEARQFLLDLCTPAELEAMADRWSVVKPIKQGQSYRTIHEQTQVSVTTIGRVARCINFGTGGYNLVCERLRGNKDAG